MKWGGELVSFRSAAPNPHPPSALPSLFGQVRVKVAAISVSTPRAAGAHTAEITPHTGGIAHTAGAAGEGWGKEGSRNC